MVLTDVFVVDLSPFTDISHENM